MYQVIMYHMGNFHSVVAPTLTILRSHISPGTICRMRDETGWSASSEGWEPEWETQSRYLNALERPHVRWHKAAKKQ